MLNTCYYKSIILENVLFSIRSRNSKLLKGFHTVNFGNVKEDWVMNTRNTFSLQTHHVDSTLKRRGNGRFHVVPTWNPRGVFVRQLLTTNKSLNYLNYSITCWILLSIKISQSLVRLYSFILFSLDWYCSSIPLSYLGHWNVLL